MSSRKTTTTTTMMTGPQAGGGSRGDIIFEFISDEDDANSERSVMSPAHLQLTNKRIRFPRHQRLRDVPHGQASVDVRAKEERQRAARRPQA